MPDKIYGEQVKAVIVPKPGAEIAPEEIDAHCRKMLADHKIPRVIEFTGQLPRNPSGKVMKNKLR